MAKRRNTPRSAPTRRRRADCFFGLHFDHHAGLKDTILNDRVTPALVERIIKLARPDYIQHDCKGHPGIAGYPDSIAGVSPPALKKDALRIYRDVTRKRGVNLYMHFSGVSDRQVVADHPEWMAIGGEKKIETMGCTSTFGPYVRERMIPQMIEVIDRYSVDGFWVDGDCWAVAIDHSEAAQARFRQITGQDAIPTEPGQPGWFEWMTVQRDQFFNYVKTYVDAVHEHDPACEVCSNWLYSGQCPEPVRVPTDFISGDFSTTDSVNSARFEARLMSNVGLPWDLMAWAFVSLRNHGGRIHKPAEQLQQEAATVLALGGGFQFYFHPDRHGGFAEHQLQLMKRTADFCLPRKSLCWKSETIPQVAVLLDSTSHLKTSPAVYSPWQGEYNALHGALHAVLEAGHHADVVADHQLNWQQDHFPVIVVPEWAHVPPGLVQELADYARRGGSLLLLGADTAGLFDDHLGVELVGSPTQRKAYLQVDKRVSSFGEGGSVLMHGLWQDVKLRKGRAKAVAMRTPGHEEPYQPTVAATIARLGKGRIAAVYGPLGTAHYATHNPWTRDLIDHLLRKLYTPMVTMTGGDGGRVPIDLVLRDKDDRIVIHLCSVAGLPTQREGQSAYLFVDRVPTTGPVTLAVRLPGKPRKVRLHEGVAFDGRPLRGTWKKGVLTITLPAVHIHSAVTIA
jgi:hypothetical protein